MTKPLPPILFAACAALMFAAERLPGADGLPAGLRAAGWALAAAGVALAVTARRQFASAGTNIYTFDEPGQRVTGGAFKLSRHPMYLGFTLALAGLALHLRSLPALALVAAFAAVSDRWYIAFEERWLRQKFGQAYADYARRTRRWL